MFLFDSSKEEEHCRAWWSGLKLSIGNIFILTYWDTTQPANYCRPLRLSDTWLLLMLLKAEHVTKSVSHCAAVDAVFCLSALWSCSVSWVGLSWWVSWTCMYRAVCEGRRQWQTADWSSTAGRQTAYWRSDAGTLWLPSTQRSHWSLVCLWLVLSASGRDTVLIELWNVNGHTVDCWTTVITCFLYASCI